MIQVQILVGDLHKGHVGSDDVIWGQRQFFPNMPQLERDTDMGVIWLFVLSRLIDWYAIWPTWVNMWPSRCLDLRSNIDPTIQGHQVHASTRLDERSTVRIKSLTLLVQKLLAKNMFCQPKKLLDIFLSLAPKTLMLTKIWWQVSEITAQELSNAFSPASYLSKIVSEIKAHFWRNMKFH